MKIRRELAYPAVGVAILLALAGCSAGGGSGSGSASGMASPMAGSSMSSDSMTPGASMSSGTSMTPSESASASRSTATQSTAATAGMIEIKEFAYQVRGAVGAGSTVAVKNNDDTTHTVTADDGSFGVTVKPGESMSFKAPAKPGRYAFHCEFHGNMNAELTVK